MELLRLLRRFRNSYDIIGVKCVNPGVATVACRDRRVDVVFFDPRNRKVRFNHSLANLIRGAFEINLLSTLLNETNGDIFSTISKQAVIAREHKVKVILSSGSNAPGMIRSPSQIAALGSTIGLSDEQSIEGVSETPRSIITRNSILRSPEYVEEGVRVILPKAR
jgi:RNase P/RNase MRP subunit p30